MPCPGAGIGCGPVPSRLPTVLLLSSLVHGSVGGGFPTPHCACLAMFLILLVLVSGTIVAPLWHRCGAPRPPCSLLTHRVACSPAPPRVVSSLSPLLYVSPSLPSFPSVAPSLPLCPSFPRRARSSPLTALLAESPPTHLGLCCTGRRSPTAPSCPPSACGWSGDPLG